jgi:hypothetical protein
MIGANLNKVACQAMEQGMDVSPFKASTIVTMFVESATMLLLTGKLLVIKYP